jgi:flagellar FliL protein
MKISLFTYLFVIVLSMHISTGFASSASNAESAYFAIDKPFVVNLSGGENLTYLQVNVQFKLKKPALRSQLQTQMPAIEHTMVMLLSEQTVSGIKSVQGKQALRESALKSVQQVCQKLIGDPVIEDVYFTGFIIQ